MFNAKQFCDDHSILWYPPGKNVARGWIGIRCPFCDDTSSHGGFHLNKGFYSCWKCGGRNLISVIRALTGTQNTEQCKAILKKYSSGIQPLRRDKTQKKGLPEVRLPPGTGLLNERAKQYLKSRNFDPYKLIREWGLMSTGHIGPLKNRILAPIYFQYKIVSYQCRAMTDEGIRYLPCDDEDEVVPFKNIVYGLNNISSRQCLVVEGITDVWRMGAGSLATFGTGFTKKQVFFFAKNFDHIFIMYDSSYEAQEQAQKLCQRIGGLGRQAEILELTKGDPAELTDEESAYWMRQLSLR